MSFDLSSILKNEITKKTEELKSSSERLTEAKDALAQTPAEPQEGDSDNNSQEDEYQSPDIARQLEDKLNRLKTRPERIKQKIEADSSFASAIDPLTLSDPEKLSNLSLQCNIYIHELISFWQEYREEYHEELLLDTKKSLFPLLVQLRRGTLPRDLVVSLSTVLYHLQQESQNTLAIESYMKLSIGNIAWPIGVTSVGIHARSANSKIQGENGQIANIMMNDRTRLWITSIKRLISFKEWLDKRLK